MPLSEKLLFGGIFRHLENKDWCRACSPQGFYPLAHALIPWVASAALISCAVALYLGFFVAPRDPYQGEVGRIVFIHVPASGVSMLIFLLMATLAGMGFAFNARLPAMAAQALAPTGLVFAFLQLWTGCLWGKAVWGNWWLWDLRMYWQLILVLLYIGFIGLHAAMEDLNKANKAGFMLLLPAALGIPVSFAAVKTWTALHQATLPAPVVGADPSAGELAGLLAMGLGFLLYAGTAGLLRLKCVILESERQSDWVARQGSDVP